MSPRPGAGTAAGGLLRASVVLLLAAGPLLCGAVHEPVFVPLLAGCALAGAGAWLRALLRRRRGDAVPALPGWKLLLALHVLVLVQLAPLPLPLLRVVSPGSHAHYAHVLLDPVGAWRPVSVSPPDTLRGLAFLAAFSLLAAAVFYELTERVWRRRLQRAVVAVGVVLTVVALVQAASPEPTRIWGVWRPKWDWAVFGPYVNGSHLSGYLLMPAGLAMGATLDALGRLRKAWQRRRRLRFLVLGDAEGTAFVRAGVVTVVLAVGIVAARARGPIAAFLCVALLLPFAARLRRTGSRAALVVAALAAVGVAWIGLEGFLNAMETRGIRRSRVELWLDVLPMVPSFPLLGAGLNAFSTAYPAFQHVDRVGADWVGEAHNEYLQALLDMGVVGAGLIAALLCLVARHAWRRARQSGPDLGIAAGLLGVCLVNLVDFDWQIPANAATWVALAALACRSRRSEISQDAA